ncbi:monocarboxylate transporter 4-like isoform X2 [Mytilus californianus]|uniref:monocarboxylate transporter 4-like isoform X2 n=1 Tax=Mytilus californianus TaxID=6549 RepID=UPI002247D06C|nr:monocarboxylate transporter 4-like isoform X2 [Mytilus californianus]
MIGPFVSSVSSLFSCRRIVIVGGCLQFVGYLLSAFVSTVNLLYVTLGIVVGIGNGLTITSSLLILNEFFDRKLPLATGIVLSGAGIGNIIFSPLIDFCLKNYGYQGTLMISAAIALNVQITAATFSQKRPKQGQIFSFSKQLSDMMDIDLLKTPAFAFCIITNTLSSMGFYVPFAFLPNSAAHYGIEETNIPWLISMIGCSSSLGRPFIGWMAVTFYRHKIVLYSFILTVCGISILMMQIWREFYFLAIACAIFGVTSGGTVCLSTSILPDIVLPKSLCNSVGITLLFQGLGSIIGTPVAGGLTEMVMNDGIIYIYGGSTFLCAAITLVPIIYITTSEKHRQRFNQKALVTVESDLPDIIINVDRRHSITDTEWIVNV